MIIILYEIQIIYIFLIVRYISKKITNNEHSFFILFISFISIPFSTNILLQPISFHQLTSTLILVHISFKYFFPYNFREGLIQLSKPIPLLLNFISIFIYEIGLPVFLCSFITILFGFSKVRYRYIIILIFSYMLLLIFNNPKTLFDPSYLNLMHIDNSIIFQINRYLFYMVYYIKYCILNGLLYNHQTTLLIINIGLIATLFIFNKLSLNQFKDLLIMPSSVIIVLLLLLSIWLYFPIMNGFIRIPTINTIFTYSIFVSLLFLCYFNNFEWVAKNLLARARSLQDTA